MRAEGGPGHEGQGERGVYLIYEYSSEGPQVMIGRGLKL